MSVNVSVYFEEEKYEMLLFGKVKTVPFQAHLECFDHFKTHILILQKKKKKSVYQYALKLIAYLHLFTLTD